MPRALPAKRHPYNQWSPDARALDLVGDKWTLLIVRDLLSGPRRFVELQRVLPGISTEQLRSRLNRMVADGLLTRRRFREVPPRVEYELTGRGRDLAPVLHALAAWGHEWAWGTPREGEAIDLTAVFRLAAGREWPAESRSAVELVVAEDRQENSICCCLEPVNGLVAVRERSADHSVARVIGSKSQWLSALSPQANRSCLRISGDEDLATRLLDLLSPRPAPVRAHNSRAA